jgi:ABC-type nitrate/sulfonate/bicarbonate transport system substrate-binding protein
MAYPPTSRRTFLYRGLQFVGILGTGLSLPSCDEDNKKKRNATMTTIKMQSPWINDAEFTGYFVGLQNGYYSSEKLNFEYLSGGPDIVADTVLLAGNCDVALTTPDGTVNEIINQKAPIKIIGAQYQKSPL